MTDSDTPVAVQRWFRSGGIPHFIDDDSASRVLTRAPARPSRVGASEPAISVLLASRPAPGA